MSNLNLRYCPNHSTVERPWVNCDCAEGQESGVKPARRALDSGQKANYLDLLDHLLRRDHAALTVNSGGAGFQARLSWVDGEEYPMLIGRGDTPTAAIVSLVDASWGGVL